MSARHSKPPLLLDFGDCVRQLRLARGYSQEAFADLCEIDRSYMGGIERGERNIALINIIRIVQALELEPSEFFRGLDSGPRAILRQKREAESERRTLRTKHQRLVKPKKPADAL